MTPTDPLAADDAIVAEADALKDALVRWVKTGEGPVPDDIMAPYVKVRAIADKRGRALRAIEAMHYEATGTGGHCACELTWPCPTLARIREILGGGE